MADDVLEDAGPVPEAGKVKREPPTIDLAATKVSETASAEPKPSDDKPSESKLSGSKPSGSEPPEEQPAVDTAPGDKPAEPKSNAEPDRTAVAISPWVIAPLSGAVAASLVILVGWLLGWPTVQAPPAAPQVSAAAVDDLGKRVAGLESKIAKPVADPAMTARIDTLEKSLASLRGGLANLHAQSDKLAGAVNEAKSAPRDSGASASAVDLSAISARIDQIERTNRAQAAASKPADDQPLRRVVAAALLDVAVRHGDPFGGALQAAKALAPDADKLKPLDPFAEKGVPHPPALTRELLTLVSKLSPAAESPTTGSGIVDRLQAGASKLVRIERTDAAGNDRSAVVARVTAAALRNDLADARRELASLDAADRAPAQAWLDKAAARDAALAASRQFAEEAMASLANSAQ
jgi:hypothetical protein